MSKIKEKVSTVGGKISNKLPDKLKRKEKEPSKRITNDTVAEHREKILAEGRKFKYPLQYAKHKILINTIIVVIIATIAFGGWLYFMLYQKQASSDFFYNATKILFLPVANVDGQNVSYADYLRRARSAIFYKEHEGDVDLNSSDGQRELSCLKRDEMDKAERAAYATKIAKSKNITVSDKEVDAEINRNLKASNGESMAQADYENVLRQYYGWTMNDYRIELRNQLLERKVAFAVDTAAKDKIAQAEARLKAGEDFATVVSEMSDDKDTRNTGGGIIARTGDADLNGLVKVVRELGDGTLSSIIQGVDGYYIVKLGSKTDDETKYLMVKVALTEFKNNFKKLRETGKIKEYINIQIQESCAIEES
jgi:parvulin-like peptidyl-prolyl isomerase